MFYIAHIDAEMDTFMVMRVNKTKNYTVMCNEHLRDKSISLKAIGLLSIILSLPDDWDYSVAGLESIVKEGNTAVRSALKELEKSGYISRHAIRDDKGKIIDWEYNIYESKANNPEYAKKAVGKASCPVGENPQVDSPQMGNSPQLNTKRQKTKKQKTNTSVGNDVSSEQSATADCDSSIPSESNRSKKECDSVKANRTNENGFALSAVGARAPQGKLNLATSIVKSLTRIEAKGIKSEMVKNSECQSVSAFKWVNVYEKENDRFHQERETVYLNIWEACDFWLNHAAYRESARETYISKFLEAWQRVLDYHKNDFWMPARGSHGVLWKNVIGKYADNWNLGSKTEIKARKKQNVPDMNWD